MGHSSRSTAPPTPLVGTPKRRGIVVAVGAGMMILGSYLPWATVTSGGSSDSIGGTDFNGGRIGIALGIAAAVIAVLYLRGNLRKKTNIATLSLGGLATLVYVLNWGNLKKSVGAADQTYASLDHALGVKNTLSVSVGLGLVLALAGAVMVVVWRALALFRIEHATQA
jgi:Tryptophan-associated transmembrane protein (Trp_oprn_chp)